MYGFHSYDYKDRWQSYWHQLDEVLKLKPSNVLEIGKGSGLVAAYLRNQGIDIKTLDSDEKLNPDLRASVLQMPVENNSFDVVLCAEVLEHLPFDDFGSALAEIKRVSRGPAVLSLPHFGPPIKLSFKLPLIKEISLAWKIPFPKKHVFHGEHYWEMGKKGYPVKKIRAAIRKFFNIEKEFVPFENQYHHFFILMKKT